MASDAHSQPRSSSPSDRLLQGIANATNRLLTVQGYHASVEAALAVLGPATDVDRIYIFENHPHPMTGRPACSQRWEWVAQGVTAEIGNPNLQNLNYHPTLARWYDQLAQGEPVTGLIHNFPTIEQGLLQPQGIQSILVVPILMREVFWGFVGFDDCHRPRHWDEGSRAVLMTLASSLGGAIFQQRVEADLKQVNETLERRVQARTAKLQQAKELAEAANRAKTTFLANMSHELRSPLNAVLGFTQVMLRNLSANQGMLPHAYVLNQRENLSIVYRSGDHLLALINDLLDMAVIEAGQITLWSAPFDLRAMLEALVEMLQLRADQKGLKLVYDCPDQVPQGIYGDERKLRQVLLNLVGNALKFTASGSVTLRIEVANPAPEMDRPAPPAATELVFSVTDTGMGITPEELQQLFQPFVQARAGQQAQTGAGLGLAICQQFIQLMGGDLTVESTPGVGSSFRFSIPVQAVQIKPERPPLGARRIIALAPGQPTYRILVADDQWENRQLLRQLLEPIGFKVYEAENGQEAVDLWRRYRPHLIWMDIRMPVMNGYQATRAIKADPAGQATVVIALTASVLEEERANVFQAGCDGFVRKPIQATAITDIMAHHLDIRYLYESDQLGSPPPSKVMLTVSALQALPQTWLRQFMEAMTRLDQDEMMALIDDISTDYGPLAQTLAQSVYNFEYELLRSLMQGQITD
jgi:two-component system sensor histidine kinase/response regulator